MCKESVKASRYVLTPKQRLWLDAFTAPLHSPNHGQFAVRAVQRDCHWGLKNSCNFHWSREPKMQLGTGQSHSIFRPTIHKRGCQPIGGRVSYPLTVLLPLGFDCVCGSLACARSHTGLLPRVRGFWYGFVGVCSLTYCNGNFRFTRVSELLIVIL